jgi:uncharacterized protein YndB with AHSA1/START domain
MSYSLTVDIFIQADAQTVWDAMMDPENVKKVFWGTTFEGDWRIGGQISYSGEWEGQTYKDYGTILELEIPHKLIHTYWSSMSGTEEKPENFHQIAYRLTEVDGGTKVEIVQTKIPREEQRDHSIQGWTEILSKYKTLIEEGE